MISGLFGSNIKLLEIELEKLSTDNKLIDRFLDRRRLQISSNMTFQILVKPAIGLERRWLLMKFSKARVLTVLSHPDLIRNLLSKAPFHQQWTT